MQLFGQGQYRSIRRISSFNILRLWKISAFAISVKLFKFLFFFWGDYESRTSEKFCHKENFKAS